jgi:anti-anti-sigma factor
LTADIDIRPGTAVLTLRGQVTVKTVSQLESFGQQALAVSPKLLLNLTQIDRIDSCALGTLLELQNLACGELSLADVPPQVLKTLVLLKLDMLFPIYPSVEAYFEYRALRDSIQPAVSFPLHSDQRTWIVLKAGRVLDSSTSQDFTNEGTIALSSNPFLICDLSKTIFLTSAGLFALSKLQYMARTMKGDFRVVSCSPNLLQVIKKSHYEQILSLYSTFSQAVA